jgi:SAM-dependent methyltransferase
MTKEASAGNRLESAYYEFMGYDGDRTRDGQSHYLQFFPAGPVLELACGRGEFLDLLRDAGVEAVGVDLDDGMVERATGAGHRVVRADAVEHLEQQPAGSLGGVFCAHFLEHLVPADVCRVYAAAARALRPGGVFVAAVPHAASLSIMGYDFWRDPTHVRFYDPMLLAFFADRAGLTVVESGGNPRNSPGPPPPTIPMEYQPEASLSDSLASLADQAQRAYQGTPTALRRRQRNGTAVALADQRAELWARLSHLVSLLDSRVQAVQHQNAVLRTAYLQLLAQLYPASEVYVVAKLPEEGAA